MTTKDGLVSVEALRRCETSPASLLFQQQQQQHVSTLRSTNENLYELRFSDIERRLSNVEVTQTMAVKNKASSPKLSWLKPVTVLLSPSNPYEEFHRLFVGINKEEFPLNDYSCALSRDILLHGRLFVTRNWICFYSNIFGFETVVKLECRKIKSITRAKTAYMFPNAIMVRTEKKKFLFCSFLTRDSTYKLLSSTWQQATNIEDNNNKGDSGVDDNVENGEVEEEDIADDTSSMAENPDYTDLTVWKRRLKDGIPRARHPRTNSCPDTLSDHQVLGVSLEEAITSEHAEHCTNHYKKHTSQRKGFGNYLQRYVKGPLSVFVLVLQKLFTILSYFCSFFKRSNSFSEMFFLIFTLTLILLLATTVVLIHRISNLEERFHNKITITDLNELNTEQLESILNIQKVEFIKKAERLNELLNVIMFSVANVQAKLEKARSELDSGNDRKTLGHQ